MADGLEFELMGVKAYYESNTFYGFKIQPVQLYISFVVSYKNKLPKEKRLRVEQIKEDYKTKKMIRHDYYKVKLWKEYRAYVELDKILSGDFNLKIP